MAKGQFASNVYAKKADELVRALADYAADRGHSLRIYPHPYERQLLRQGVELPYADLIDPPRVTIDTDGADSRQRIYEPRVAVSLQSSFIWERLDLGLDASFIFSFGDPELDAFNPESLGQYAKNVFSDVDGLRTLLDGSLTDS